MEKKKEDRENALSEAFRRWLEAAIQASRARRQAPLSTLSRLIYGLLGLAFACVAIGVFFQESWAFGAVNSLCAAFWGYQALTGRRLTLGHTVRPVPPQT